MNQIWDLLLDDDFMEAYVHGMLIKCGDGITRRVFPRIFAYLADYPEKSVSISRFLTQLTPATFHRCLVTCIRFLAQCPCPACLVRKTDIPNMGTSNDMKARERDQRKDDQPVHYDIAHARSKIFETGAAPEGSAVEAITKRTSITSTRVSHTTYRTHGVKLTWYTTHRARFP